MSKRRFSLCFSRIINNFAVKFAKYEEEALHHNSADGGIRAKQRSRSRKPYWTQRSICCVQELTNYHIDLEKQNQAAKAQRVGYDSGTHQY